MTKILPLTKVIELGQFRSRGCTVCRSRVIVESYNGRTGGRYGEACGKYISCKDCDMIYLYAWDYSNKNYKIERAIINGGNYNSGTIEYTLKTGKNVSLTIYKSDYESTKENFICRSWSMPKRKLYNLLKDKLETYAVFS